MTAATLGKAPVFNGPEKLDLLENQLLTLARSYDWALEAWAVFPNHYHWVGRNECSPDNLSKFVRHLHGTTARELNRLEKSPGRKIWHNYWDTPLTFEKSYLARLHYVHQNPVHHGLVPVANQYRWGSAAWFERTGTSAQVSTIYSMPIDILKIEDDY